TNAKIADDAGIQGTKISPDFGDQAIVTTSNLSIGGAFSANIREMNQALATITDSDYTVIIPNTTTSITIPDPMMNQGRILIIKNLTGAQLPINLTNGYIPSQGGTPSTVFEMGVTQIQSDGTNWQ